MTFCFKWDNITLKLERSIPKPVNFIKLSYEIIIEVKRKIKAV